MDGPYDRQSLMDGGTSKINSHFRERRVATIPFTVRWKDDQAIKDPLYGTSLFQGNGIQPEKGGFIALPLSNRSI
jgi:hypothetical protein